MGLVYSDSKVFDDDVDENVARGVMQKDYFLTVGEFTEIPLFQRLCEVLQHEFKSRFDLNNSETKLKITIIYKKLKNSSRNGGIAKILIHNLEQNADAQLNFQFLPNKATFKCVSPYMERLDDSDTEDELIEREVEANISSPWIIKYALDEYFKRKLLEEQIKTLIQKVQTKIT